MGSDWDPRPALQRKGKHVLVKLLVLAILVGLSFRLLYSRSAEFLESPAAVAEREASATPTAAAEAVLGLGNAKPLEDSPSTNPSASVSEAALVGEKQVSQQGSPITNSSADAALDHGKQVLQQKKCDFFTGQWIRNPSGPAYTNESCRFIEPPQDCLKNGRPDTGYLFWKWKPHGCDVSPFDAVKFFNAMRNKSWALIGDSILRNQAQSLICLLSKVEEPIMVYHDEEFKSKRWIFPSHNFNLSLIWAPFLIKAEIFENDEGESKSENRLHIDTLDELWTSQYSNFDYIVISGGQWFLKTAIYVENNTVVGCHYCPKLNLSDISLEYSYGKTLNSIYRFLAASEHKPVMIYRTWTPDHFEDGEWFSGGVCNRTEPYKNGEFSVRDFDHLMRKIEINEFNKAAALDGSHLKLLDTYQLSMQRPDSHPGPYRKFHPFEQGKSVKVQDCLHWCLPGAIDTWNDLMMELIMT
ncbi:protein trichome birefringence-like 23 isoform X1 [Canna indica]|uniref:Protein trichome birefringence-like 23 isoform X1 n=1 Tax=Canna indica TaxID=4628 RepID=A0AAQ3Q2E9_9LILI|nr:protein trichome birefringence-like 23 isoform X1 [Canna indica]